MSIVTFYSYKGGVGRSLALANVAVQLAKSGKKVLAVDWDLEAPGLEEYFEDFRVDADGRGLLFLLNSQDVFINHKWRLTSTREDFTLDLIPSGRDERDYYKTLERFDLDKFFASGGGDFLESLRNEWLKNYDFVLIDSRTGLSDAGGICTILMPDIIVGMFTATRQSCRGVRDVLTLARGSRQELAYPRTQFSVIPIPCRLNNTDKRETRHWMEEFADAMTELTNDWRPKTLDMDSVLGALRVDHAEPLLYGTKIIDEGYSAIPSQVSIAYHRIVQLLASDLKDISCLGSEKFAGEIPKKDNVASENLQNVYEFDCYLSVASGSVESRWVEEVFLAPFEKCLFNIFARQPKIFFEQHELSVGQEWNAEIRSAIEKSRAILVFVTGRTSRSEWMNYELEHFRKVNSDGVVVPINLGHSNALRKFESLRTYEFQEFFVTNSKSISSNLKLENRLSSAIDALAQDVAKLLGHSQQASYRVYLSAASGELASYRADVGQVLRRKGIEVCDQTHFRQGGAILLETLKKYIEECDAVICLIGDQCGSFPTRDHMAVMDVGEWTNLFRHASGKHEVSYTQWEFLLAKSVNKPIYIYMTDKGFVPDNDVSESMWMKDLQVSYRTWIANRIGMHWDPLATTATLIEDVLVLPFPDLARGKPNNLPYSSLGTLFQGRNSFLQDLNHQLTLSNKGTAAITDKSNPHRVQVVYGSGGIGKTRTVIEYAWRYAAQYNALLFLPSQTPETLQSSLAGLTDVLLIADQSQAPDEHRIRAVLNWLQTHPGWLLILDNVDTDEMAAAVKELLPRLIQGHVLITSRLSRWSAGTKTLDLGVLEPSDATDYLLQATDTNRVHTEQDSTHAERVAIKVGQLALGLEHAAAYINARYLSFNDYLTQWQRDEAKILETFDLDLIEYPKELLITWKLSVDQLDDDARELLDVLSWLSPEPVPDAFFQAAPDEGHLQARKAITTLHKYSLAIRVQEGEQRGFQINRFIQSTTRCHQLTDPDGLPALDRALAWINKAFQSSASDVRDWPMLESLAEHVNTVCEFGFKYHKTGQDQPTSRLLSDLAQLYQHKARYADAEPLMRRALQIDERNLGEDHPTVAIRLNNLAQLLQATNRLSEAEPLMHRALQIDERNLGEDHPTVAIRLNNLAQLLQATNRLSEAEPLMHRALTIDEKSFGEDHPNLAIRLNNLAQLLQATNRLSEAESLMRRALHIEAHSFGEEHPKLATRLSNLASLLQATNRLSEAEPLMRRALTIDEMSFGEDHPNVAIRLNNLAHLLQATNRLSEAEPLMRRALIIDERSFGEDHPRVAVQLNNLAQLLQDTSRLSEAEPLMRRALTIDEKSFGEDHPNVAVDLSNLATLLQATNRLSEAEPLMRRALTIDEVSFGEDHPNVAIRLNNLAQLLQATNRLSEAEPLMRRALIIDERSFGEDHPKVAIRLNNLAQLLQATNRLSEAEPLMRRVVEIIHDFGKATGHDHPYLETFVKNYRILLLETGLSIDQALARVQEILSEADGKKL